ncbi:unnamed protein product [Scytosiphon promiscuus]
MKYGKQLERNSYGPWMDKYLAYGKIKRMLKRYHFVKMRRQEGEEDAELQFARKEAARAAEAAKSPPPSQQQRLSPRQGNESERTPLQQATRLGTPSAAAWVTKVVSPLLGQREGGKGGRAPETAGEEESPSMNDEEGVLISTSDMEEHEKFVRLKRQESAEERVSTEAEFFGVVDQELHKVDEFYRGKYADLDQVLRDFEARGTMSNSWAVPSGNTLTPLFEAYTEITALGTFVEMNGEGFRKIVKKYDKTMGTEYLDSFLVRLQKTDFYQSKAAESLLERVQGLVSRDKLLDMKRHAELAHMDSSEKAIFPAVKFTPLIVSVLVNTCLDYVPAPMNEIYARFYCATSRIGAGVFI